MDFLKKAGHFTGKMTGLVIGGSVRVVGELAGSPFIKEIGDSVEKVTVKTGDTLGTAASGLWDTGAGLITADPVQRDSGLADLGGAARSVARGTVQGAEYVYRNGKDAVDGLRENDSKQVKSAAKNLVKAAAIGALAVGVIDVVDGPDGIEG
ncbi:hypothetical protein [Gorillibacterium massiliense]|uniref:hypothetical protein n=1 Tax=Gorillibacterium massiliense TaxID=1280390 RepID=UPI0004B28B9D|nr:hypothetical protein [Gorillibacterium massiliense]